MVHRCIFPERPDLIDDPYFTAPENFAGNAEARDAFEAILLEWTLVRTKKEVTEKAQSVGYICSPLNTMDEVFQDPHLLNRGYFTEIDHPYTGPIKYAGPQLRMAETPWRAGRAPLLGEHTSEVLQERCGLSGEDVARLRSQGAL